MSKITIAKLSQVAGTTVVTLNGWLARLDLSTDFEQAKAGPAKQGRFSRENALELALIGRLVREAGMSPSAAAANVKEMLAKWGRAKPDGYVLIVGDKVTMIDRPPSAGLLSTLGAAGVIVSVRWLSEQIDKAFADAR